MVPHFGAPGTKKLGHIENNAMAVPLAEVGWLATPNWCTAARGSGRTAAEQHCAIGLS